MAGLNSSNQRIRSIEQLVSSYIQKLGYELVDLEFSPKSSHGSATLRLFIDSLSGTPISFDDCATVDHQLDEVFTSPEFEQLVPEGFTLEVSSPGIDRPLKKPEDFVRFVGSPVLIKTVRALSLEEMGNAIYFEHHQKQKNFFGTLRSFKEEAIELETDGQRFFIPFSLVTKAQLDVSSKLET
ncbi:MAG: ribosome maturation factor RimP [Oligoflexia bacterium]|nr:ribosome maturation factor RimP [Oligoflexia bacterium]